MTSELNPPALTRAPQLEPALGAPAAHCRRLTARRASPHNGSSGHVVPETAQLREAPAMRAFAEASLRVVLETIDQRRPVHHVKNYVTAALLDQVRGLAARSSQAPRRRAASLGRVHLRTIDEGTAEVFGSYSRGERNFAIAARVSTGADGSLRVTALAIPD